MNLTTNGSGDPYWAGQNYQAIATPLAVISESLVDRAAARLGESVLDVATATGNAALAAARRGCQVTGIDTDEDMLAVARARAAAEFLPATFVCDDAQELSFPDDSFDLVISAYGAMFAPDYRRTALELARVCRPSGRIALAHWNPDSVITHMFQAIHEHHPAVQPLVEVARVWATHDGLSSLFGHRAQIQTWHSYKHVCAASSADWATTMTENFGPALLVRSDKGPDEAERLRTRLSDLFEQYNEPDGATARIRIDYLEAIIRPA